MGEGKDLAKFDPQNDSEWREIVEKIVREIGEGVPDNVIEATELMIAGWPTYKIAKRLNTKPAIIRRWLELYPSMAVAVAKGRKLMQMWRMARLEQQFALAIEKSEEILDLDLEDRAVNSKVVGVVAQHARFIISLFVGQQIDVNVKVEEGEETLKAKQDALQYLAGELAKQRGDDKPIEATYRVIDADPDESTQKPLLLADGNPAYGKLGELDTNEEGTLCHICGKRARNLSLHVGAGHHLKPSLYEMIYMLERGSLDSPSGETPDDPAPC